MLSFNNMHMQNPPKEFSPAPLWFWFGTLESHRLQAQMDEMVDKHVWNAFMHSRAYLKTPYLEQPWWDAVDSVVSHAEKTGFFPWLYDEYAWPSGTAGSTFPYSDQPPSRVIAEGKQNMAKGLRWRLFSKNEISAPAMLQDDIDGMPCFVFSIDFAPDGSIANDRIQNITASVLSGNLPQTDHQTLLAFYLYYIPNYVDYLRPDTIQRFIQLTHEEYYKRYGQHFGNMIPGIFFDEIFNAGTPIAWTETLPEKFSTAYGYPLESRLPLLIFNGESAAQVRADYYQLITDMYEAAFFGPISRWCEQHNLLLTGHTEEHLALQPLRQGDYFQTMRHLHLPGGDCHDYRYKYPRLITLVEPKGAVSAARLNNRTKAMSEAMGGGGWATSLQEFKRGVNTLAAMGIGMFVLHGFHYETDHQGSQCDWPSSFFFQNPYWSYFAIFADYIARLSYLNTAGTPICRVGLYYPIPAMRHSFANGAADAKGMKLDRAYHAMLDCLLKAQIDTDIIDENSILQSTFVDGELVCGMERFQAIVIPDIPGMSQTCLQKLQEFEQSGGHVLLYNCAEQLSIAQQFQRAIVLTPDAQTIRTQLQPHIVLDFEIIAGAHGQIYYNCRTDGAATWYLIVNEANFSTQITARMRGAGTPLCYDLETGLAQSVASVSAAEDYVLCNLSLDANSAICIVFGANVPSVKPASPAHTAITPILLPKIWNILPVDIGTHHGAEYLHTAVQQLEIPVARLYSAHTGWEDIRICNRPGDPGNCGRHMTNWNGTWISRRPSWGCNGNLEQLFFRKEFVLDSAVQTADACIVVTGNYTVYVNGTAIAAGCKNAELSVSQYLKTGKNVICIAVQNPYHMPDVSLLQVEMLPPDCLTSLLFECHITTTNGTLCIKSDKTWIVNDTPTDRWTEIAPDIQAQTIDPQIIADPWKDKRFGQWLTAWERGRPPILPWGTVPLFGKTPTYPQNIAYCITLPAGVCRVYQPDVLGNCTVKLDDTDVSFTGGILHLQPDNNTHQLVLFVTATDGSCGLRAPVKVDVVSIPTMADNWGVYGYPWYSGTMRYQTSFTLPSLHANSRYRLSMEQVHFYAEVFVNGKPAGVRLWEPYNLDVTDLLQEGENEIIIFVSNTAGNRMAISLLDEGRAVGWNRYWCGENILRDKQNLISGLLGNVTLLELQP